MEYRLKKIDLFFIKSAATPSTERSASSEKVMMTCTRPEDAEATREDDLKRESWESEG